MSSKQRRAELDSLIERYMSGEINRRSFLKSVGALAAAATLATSGVAGIGSAAAQDASRVRKLGVLTQPQASVPEEFESIQLAASQITQLGIELDVQAMPYDQLSDIVWFDRPTWDMTAWQMVGRPERLDPDEFIYNLFHSSTAEDGYNFVGYINPEYDALAEAQRSEIDLEKRQAIVLETQKIVARDQPYTFFVYPAANYAFNKTIFDENTMVDAKGIGIKNYWTFVGATPLGDQKDMILNTLVVGSGDQPALHLRRHRLLDHRVDLGSPDARRPGWTANAIGGDIRRMGRQSHLQRHASRRIDLARRPAGDHRRRHLLVHGSGRHHVADVQAIRFDDRVGDG